MGNGSCDVPLAGELGNYIGAQMAGVNLVDPPPCVTPPSKPVLLIPWNGELRGRHSRLNWTTADCADDYTVIVRRDSTAGPKVEQSAAQPGTRYRVVNELVPGHTYYWKVKACGAGGCKASGYSHFSVQ